MGGDHSIQVGGVRGDHSVQVGGCRRGTILYRWVGVGGDHSVQVDWLESAC